MNLDYNPSKDSKSKAAHISSPFVARSRRGKGNSSAIWATESSSRASRIISNFRRGAKNEQLLPNPGERRRGVSLKFNPWRQIFRRRQNHRLKPGAKALGSD